MFRTFRGIVDLSRSGSDASWRVDSYLPASRGAEAPPSGPFRSSLISEVRSFAHPHLAIVADVQLHNREDLFRTLGVDSPVGVPDDSQLLLSAYAKWGEQCG